VFMKAKLELFEKLHTNTASPSHLQPWEEVPFLCCWWDGNTNEDTVTQSARSSYIALPDQFSWHLAFVLSVKKGYQLYTDIRI
jgi:hypothetical protein